MNNFNDNRRRGRKPKRHHRQPLEHDHKNAGISRQAHECLTLVFAEELADPAFDGVWILDVQPEPFGSALLIELVIPTGADPARIFNKLDAARGWLRSEVATAIHRKRAPNLRFSLTPETALAQRTAQEDER